MVLDEESAYKAMFYYLEDFYFRTLSFDVGGLLGAMQLDNHPRRPRDIALWYRWMDAVERVMREQAEQQAEGQQAGPWDGSAR